MKALEHRVMPCYASGGGERNLLLRKLGSCAVHLTYDDPARCRQVITVENSANLSARLGRMVSVCDNKKDIICVS